MFQGEFALHLLSLCGRVGGVGEVIFRVSIVASDGTASVCWVMPPSVTMSEDASCITSTLPPKSIPHTHIIAHAPFFKSTTDSPSVTPTASTGPSSLGSTTLHFAAVNRHPVVRTLLLHGAHPDKVDKHRGMAEMVAWRMHGHYGAIHTCGNP